jgi:hypothetical protein
MTVEVKGQTISTYLHGAVIDSWTDDRLRSGGVGFFSSQGERGRVMSMRLVHQADTLGRALAYVADPEPKKISNSAKGEAQSAKSLRGVSTEQ